MFLLVLREKMFPYRKYRKYMQPVWELVLYGRLPHNVLLLVLRLGRKTAISVRANWRNLKFPVVHLSLLTWETLPLLLMNLTLSLVIIINFVSLLVRILFSDAAL